jgi:hypothetical protein
MATETPTKERVFKVEKFYRPLREESDHGTSDVQPASAEVIIKRLRELVPLLAFTKAMVVLEEQPHSR